MASDVQVTLDAVIVAVTDERPRILGVPGSASAAQLPSGQLETEDRTLELALRRFVADQAGLRVGYVEQLYTFGDIDRAAVEDGLGPTPTAGASCPSPIWRWCASPASRRRRVGGLVRPVPVGGPPRRSAGGVWPRSSNRFLTGWAAEATGTERQDREVRAQVSFGLGGAPWDGVRVLERYELLYEVGLLAESPVECRLAETELLGLPMEGDHRRIVATSLGRLRGKLTYRPVVFELLADRFTLLQLQRLVEALSGVRLHKQNFRRLVEGAGLVEGTGEVAPTGGRPAELFRFRREVVRERPRPGVGTPWTRS